jgi:hypothetical protein
MPAPPGFVLTTGKIPGARAQPDLHKKPPYPFGSDQKGSQAARQARNKIRYNQSLFSP